MGKKVRLKKQQIASILSENTSEDSKILGHPIGGTGGEEYKPQSMDQHKKTFKSFNKKRINEGGVQVDLETFKSEVIDFIKHLLDRPMDHSFPPFWEKLGIKEKELLNAMAEVGLIAWYSPNGSVKYLAFKENFDDKVNELYNNLSSDSDEDKNINEIDDTEYTEPEEPQRKDYDLIHMNDEIAIFRKGKKGFIFPYDHISKEELEPYAEVPLKPTGFKDEEGFADYDKEEFDINEEVIYRYVNDSIPVLSFGYGREGWSNGDDMVLITNKLKDELINTYKNDEELKRVLEGESIQTEATGAAGSSGSYVTKLGGDSASQQMIKRPSYREFSPHSQIKEQKEEKVPEKMGTVEYERDMEGEEPFELNGKYFKYVWVKDQNGDSSIGVYSYEDDSVKTFEQFYTDNFKEVDEATGAGGSSGAYVQPKIWAKDQKNMTHGQKPWWPSGQIVQNPMKEQQEEPAYPGGGFVEFDDCVKLNNNKEAIEGGCSQGAKDNVVKVKKGEGGKTSDDALYYEVAKKTGRSIDEVKSIIENNLSEA